MTIQSPIWVIAHISENQYHTVQYNKEDSFVLTPQGTLLQSYNKQAMELVAESMKVSSDNLCEGLSLYAIASSTIDFGISRKNPSQMNVLLSAFNKGITVVTMEKWSRKLQQASTEQLALYMSICGTIGLNNFSYNLAVLGLLPNSDIYINICALRKSLINNAEYRNCVIDGVPKPANVIELADEFDIAYAPYIINEQFESACNSCAYTSYYLENRCALNLMFEYIAKYSSALNTISD